MGRPNFDVAWRLFAQVNIPVKGVGDLIGGKIKVNTDAGIFQNACPIRISYVLNRVGIPIPRTPYKISSGADGRLYIIRVKDLLVFLEKTFGRPDFSARAPKPLNFAGEKGLLVVKGSGWGDASGHATLWNGTVCSDTCHLVGDAANGSFIPDNAYLWKFA